ncbi:MAG: response regulator [Cytophagaceae bacterium]|nr:response regulator [Cytophagaceae bacterium]
MEILNAIHRVLLIDDDEVTNFLNSKVIEKAGIAKNISVATNGRKALDIIGEICASENACPELIFLDLNMPVMNGFEFLDKYERMEFSNKHKIKIIVLTSSSNPEDMRKIKERNLSYFIKPLSEEKIMEILK